jgi:hypothetical protein
MCAERDTGTGDVRGLELRGFLFVEPRTTAHIRSPAAPLLQVREEGVTRAASGATAAAATNCLQPRQPREWPPHAGSQAAPG